MTLRVLAMKHRIIFILLCAALLLSSPVSAVLLVVPVDRWCVSLSEGC